MDRTHVDDAAALTGKGVGDFLANATGGTGDDADIVLKLLGNSFRLD
jgi:hypothetical protein